MSVSHQQISVHSKLDIKKTIGALRELDFTSRSITCDGQKKSLL